MNRLITIFFATAIGMVASAQVTLEQCYRGAEENYPLIKKYDLVAATEKLDIAEINRAWLPRLEVYGQGSWQNVVPNFPESLSGMMAQMGGEPMRGMDKWQYKGGVDLTQTVWDGGASRAQRAIARANAERQRAAIEVDMYAIRSRVNDLFFGILLIDDQIEQTRSALEVLAANIAELRIMVEGGVAMQADADMLAAQHLAMQQNLLQAEAARSGYCRMLELFTGVKVCGKCLEVPVAEIPGQLTSARPELSLFDTVDRLAEARRSAVSVAAMPKIGLFAQTYYGYAGFDYFEAMNSRKPSLNFVGGVKVSWNIDAFYTKSLQKKKIALEAITTDVDRDTFTFNTNMLTAGQLDEIRGLQELSALDADIVALRSQVRAAAEAQLEGGVIDATALLSKINEENQARLAASYHRVQLLQTIYKLKNTLNR